MNRTVKSVRKAPVSTAKASPASATKRSAKPRATGRREKRRGDAVLPLKLLTPKGAKPARFAARLSAHEKRLIEDAAAIQGRTLTDFVLASAQEAAQRVLREAQIVSLGREASLAFARALLEPPAPNEALRRALRSGRSLGSA